MTKYFESFSKELVFAFLYVDLFLMYSSADFSNALHKFFTISALDEYVSKVDYYTLIYHIIEYIVHKFNHGDWCVAVTLLHNPTN